MSRFRCVSILLVVSVFVIVGLFGGICGTSGTVSARNSATSLSDEEFAGMVYMREEEKLARDVYLTLNARWELRIFDNIIKSEEKHMAAMLGLLDTYHIEDPVGINPVGVFIDPVLQELYDDLVTRGMTSVQEAMAVGGYVEEVDLLDLATRMDVTTNQDILRVYANLEKGSRNHLRAFVKQSTMLGVDYQAQVLEPAVLQAVIDSPMEKSGNGM